MPVAMAVETNPSAQRVIGDTVVRESKNESGSLYDFQAT